MSRPIYQGMLGHGSFGTVAVLVFVTYMYRVLKHSIVNVSHSLTVLMYLLF